MESAVAAVLPGGYWRSGAFHHEALLRPLSGEDEAFLSARCDSLPPPHQATCLLARCVARLGPAEASLEELRSLTVGDREALLLQLRRLTLGDRMPCVLVCPAPECGKKMDLDLRVRDLLLPRSPRTRDWYEISVPEEASSYRVRFRLPTGGDLEEAAPIASMDARAGAELILRRVVASVVRQDGVVMEAIPAAVASALPAILAELDPQAELNLSVTCPECGHSFSAILDATTFFWEELRGRMDQLYGEVHLLALNYHWSEAEILGLSPGRRQLYLRLLTEASGASRGDE